MDTHTHIVMCPSGNPHQVARRAAIAEQVQQYLSQGGTIEQVPTGQSSITHWNPQEVSAWHR